MLLSLLPPPPAVAAGACHVPAPPGIDLWALILQGSLWGPHRSRSSLSLARFKLCFTGSDTKPLASAPKLNLYSRLAFS